MSKELIQSQFILQNKRPFPDNPVAFFSNTKSRIFVSIASSPCVWQEDLSLAERLFADMIVCPSTSFVQDHVSAFETTRAILKMRMSYPGIKEDPFLEKIAKTWVLPTKLHLGPNVSSFFTLKESSVKDSFEPFFNSLQNEDQRIHYLKIEVENGQERNILYSILNSEFRPSLILVKWSYDLDEHISTAHCAGHVLNSGYSLVYLTEHYALYMFTDQTLYDICSMKTISIENPILSSVIQSIAETKTNSSN